MRWVLSHSTHSLCGFFVDGCFPVKIACRTNSIFGVVIPTSEILIPSDVKSICKKGKSDFKRLQAGCAQSYKYGNSSQGKSINKAYIIQVGAFSNIDNAKRMKLQISQIGYDVQIAKVETKGLKLYAVRVVRYETKFEAEKVGKLLKKKLGNEYRVLYRPQN